MTSEEVTYADLKFTTLENARDRELRTDRPKGSGGAGGHFSPRQTRTLENIVHVALRGGCHLPRVALGALWSQISETGGRKVKRQGIKKNGRVENVGKKFKI